MGSVSCITCGMDDEEFENLINTPHEPTEEQTEAFNKLYKEFLEYMQWWENFYKITRQVLTIFTIALMIFFSDK